MHDLQAARQSRLALLGKDRPVFLVVCLFVLLLVHPFIEDRPFAGRVVTGFFTLILVSSALAVMRDKRLVVATAVLGVPAIVLRWCTELLGLGDAIGALSGGLQTLFLFFVVAVLVVHLMRTSAVTANTLCRAVSAYLLMGFAWAVLYTAVLALQPGAFSIPANEASWGRMVYFSFSALTTVGFGDITPATSYARSLVVLETILGPLYLALLIARLVALYTRSRPEDVP